MDSQTLDLFAKINDALQAQFSSQKLQHELGSTLTTKYLDLQAAHQDLKARVDVLEQIIQKLRTNHDQLANEFDDHGHMVNENRAFSPRIFREQSEHTTQP